MILAIDPGPAQSAIVEIEYGGSGVGRFFTKPNHEIAEFLRRDIESETNVVIEMIASYGMPVGREVFETCVWVGRFIECSDVCFAGTVYRKDVKINLCGSMKAKDANIRQALIDRFGGKEKAIGNKKAPGPLYGIKGDEWAALAVAVTYADTNKVTTARIIVNDDNIPF